MGLDALKRQAPEETTFAYLEQRKEGLIFSAALITHKDALTSAYAVKDAPVDLSEHPPDLYIVSVGPNWNKNMMRASVIRIRKHPEYNAKETLAGIAILNVRNFI